MMTWSVTAEGIQIYRGGEHIGTIPPECWWWLIRQMADRAS